MQIAIVSKKPCEHIITGWCIYIPGAWLKAQESHKSSPGHRVISHNTSHLNSLLKAPRLLQQSMGKETHTSLGMLMVSQHQRPGWKQMPDQGLTWGLETSCTQALDIKLLSHSRSFL